MRIERKYGAWCILMTELPIVPNGMVWEGLGWFEDGNSRYEEGELLPSTMMIARGLDDWLLLLSCGNYVFVSNQDIPSQMERNSLPALFTPYGTRSRSRAGYAK